MAFTLDVSSLTKYTDQVQLPIIASAVLPSNLTSLGIDYQEGITYKSSLNILSNNLIAKAGGSCGFSATSSTALSQREITVCPIEIHTAICPDTFKEYWTKSITQAGSYNESLPNEFERIYVADKAAKVSNLVEDIFFCGAVSGTYSAATNMNLCNGVLSVIEETSASASVTRVGATYSGALNVANAINIFDLFRNAVPTDILGETDLTLFMSHANFFTLMQAVRDRNLFHIAPTENNGGMFMVKNFLGTNITVVGVRGMRFTNKMILTQASNLVMGCDRKSDYDQMKVWFSQDNQEVREVIKWRQGAQVKFPANVVIYKA